VNIFNITLINILLFFCFNSYSHNPENFIISEIEQGILTFENEQIQEEYNSALKRLRIRRLKAMPMHKKFFIFTKSGFEHILPKGLDHILFVLGLFFSCIKFRSLLIHVTAFTAAHSITLILAGQGLIQIPASIVEPLIALSIVWVAVENFLFNQPNKWRPLLIFLFGLLHGLGFASVLNYYGLPKENFISLLLAFNIGVEIGQLTVLIVAFFIVNVIFRTNSKNKKIRIPISVLISLIGTYWFIERVYPLL
tara:strand:- start:58 stop:813 length:756 start_codon:yes stop_codon:yes gene_type:complete